MKQIIIILYCIINAIFLQAQKSNIIGRIVSLNQSSPIPGAVIKYGRLISISDKNGYFSFRVLDFTDKSSLTISAIGYKNKNIEDFNLNEFIEISLEDSISNLPDVEIASSTNVLIKKAIENISNNYRQKPFKQTGILRLFFDLDNGYHYENDAIIDNFIPPYNSKNAISVRLRGNKSSFIYDSDSSNKLVRNWVQAYKIVANQDFIHKPHDFVNLKKISSYNYKLVDKYSIGNDRFFEIEFSNKEGIRGVNYKNVKGKLIIDSASLAFVKADLVFENIKNPIYVEVNKYYLTIEYKKIENLWYIDKIQSESISKKTNNIVSHSKVFYLAIENDTSFQKDFTYLEKVQNSDITQKLNISLNTEDSLRYFKLFKKAENDSLIPLKKIPLAKNYTFNKDSDKSITPYNKNYLLKFQKYVNGGNLTYGFSFNQMPFRVVNNQSNFNTNGNIAFGFSFKARIYKNLFYLLDTYFNTNAILISNNNNTGSNSIKYDFRYIISNRFLTFSPIIGLNKIKISNSTNTLNKSIYNYHIGFSQEYELTHKFNLQLTGLYNFTYKITGTKLDFISTFPISSSIGINMKL